MRETYVTQMAELSQKLFLIVSFSFIPCYQKDTPIITLLVGKPASLTSVVTAKN